jgi:hypothetical protein
MSLGFSTPVNNTEWFAARIWIQLSAFARSVMRDCGSEIPDA